MLLLAFDQSAYTIVSDDDVLKYSLGESFSDFVKRRVRVEIDNISEPVLLVFVVYNYDAFVTLQNHYLVIVHVLASAVVVLLDLKRKNLGFVAPVD